MKLKCLAFATALALSSPTMAATVSDMAYSQSALSAAFASWTQSWTPYFESLGKSWGTYSVTSFVTFPTSATVFNGYIYAADLSAIKSFSWQSAGGPFAGKIVSDAAPAVAVPAPEAGAGLGALALGGVALYMKRRRKTEALAA